MQKKHFRILVAAACLCAGLSFSAYGEETISSVPLSFSWDGAPKGGEAVGTLTATTTSQSFIVEGSEYLKDDDTWDYGEWPCAEIELSAAEGYRFSTPNRRTFSLSGCNVQYKSSEIDSDGSTLILQVYLSRIGGQLPHGRNAAAGRELPRDEGKLQLLDQLHIDRAARSNVPVHGVLCSFCIIVLRA